jgi:hypothetical protein
VSSGNVVLVLDGEVVAALRSVTGGNTFADVVQLGGDERQFAGKRLGPTRVEPLVLELDVPLSNELDEWVGNSLVGRFARRNGSVQLVDVTGEVKAVREFTGALITEVGFPACDGSSKDPAYLSVQIAPQRMTAVAPAGKLEVPQLKRGPWVASRFRLQIDGLDTGRVTRLDPFGVRAEVAAEGGDLVIDLGALAFSNLRVRLPHMGSRTWLTWFHEFVVEGDSRREREKNGTLTFLAADHEHALTEARLYGLGIFALAPDATGNLVADLYCQRVELGSVRAE